MSSIVTTDISCLSAKSIVSGSLAIISSSFINSHSTAESPVPTNEKY